MPWFVSGILPTVKSKGYHSKEAFAMATPDYLQQVIVSARARAVRDRRTYSTRFGLFRRPSMTSMVWASLDLVTVFVAVILALRVRVALPPQVPILHVLPDLIEASPRTLFL